MLKLKVIDHPITQDWMIIDIAKERPPITWERVFVDAEYELIDVSEILDQEEQSNQPYFPLKKNIFNAFNHTPLPIVKVVIVGQDPYPQRIIDLDGNGVPRAQGMSFSVSRTDVIPSSLKNIYKELQNSYLGFVDPDHGDLTCWAHQGVLMLNSCLTIREGKPGSHGEIWLGFIKKVCKAIAHVNPTCIYLLWGKDAQKIKCMIGEKSITLEAAHPSGLSANRGFFGCNHFNKANEILIKQGHTAIDWQVV